MTMKIKAAGCLVTKKDEDGNTLFLAIHRDDAASPDGWDLPCGKVEEGEYPSEAADRELNEETGLSSWDYSSDTFICAEPVDGNLVEFYHIGYGKTHGDITSSPEGEVAFVPMSNILQGNYKQFNRAMLAYFGFAVPSEEQK